MMCMRYHVLRMHVLTIRVCTCTSDLSVLGVKFVEDNFGADARPRVAWQIDPFGHSSEMASIFAMVSTKTFIFNIALCGQ